MDPRLSDKIRVISLITMVLLTLVHAYTYPSNTFHGQVLSWDGLNFGIQYLVSQGLSRFRVPMFFILSGYFFHRAVLRPGDGFLPQFQKRLRTIALPYLLWSIAGFLLYLLMQWPASMRGLFPNNPVWGLSAVQVLNKILLDPIPYQLWFLRDLMVLFALSPLFIFLIPRVGAWVLLPAAITWWFEIDLVVLANESLPFYLAGAWLFMRGPSEAPALTTGQRRTLVASWMVLLVVKTAVVLFNVVDADVVRVMHKLSTVLGLAAVWVWYDLVVGEGDVRGSFLFKLSAYSFFLYAAHEPLITVVKKSLFLLVGDSPLTALAIYVVAPLVTMVICFSAAAWLSRHVPVLYGYFTGGRGLPKTRTRPATAAFFQR
ncbi:MAG TPA: acyltransferase [Flavobacteriales bacterium]|nr:acyltransferase [Flavobacteriales bacterium]